MPFAADRDLLVLEPNLFRDVAWSAQQRFAASNGALAGATLTCPGADFAAAGVGPGAVVSVNAAFLEALARLGPTQLTVSRLRDDPQGPAIPPIAAANAAVAVWTFGPQLHAAHERTMRDLGLEAGVPAPAGAPSAADIVNPRALARIEALAALSMIFAAAASLVGEGSAAWQKAALYRERHAAERARLAALLDLDGDGVPDAARRPGALRLRRD